MDQNENTREYHDLPDIGSNHEADWLAWAEKMNFQLRVRLTTHDKDLEQGEIHTMSAVQAAAYLDADPAHAIVMLGAQDNYFGNVPFEPNVYVIRGASERTDNYYFGDMPAEDPNDAEGGDLSAVDAIAYGCGPFYM